MPPDADEAFAGRARATDWAAAAAGEAAFAGSIADLVRVAPVAEEFKPLDRPIVRNSMRFAWLEVRQRAAAAARCARRSAPTGAGRAADAGAFTPLFPDPRASPCCPRRAMWILDRIGQVRQE